MGAQSDGYPEGFAEIELEEQPQQARVTPAPPEGRMFFGCKKNAQAARGRATPRS